jgi:regulatory protein
MARRNGSGRREAPQEARNRRSLVDDPQVVSDAAMRFLETRRRSVAEVRRRLTMAGYRPELIEGAIARLVEVGLLDDEAFARAWVESRDRARPRGEQALRSELMEKGIDREIVAALLTERREREPADVRASHGEGAELDAACRLLEKRRPALLRVAQPRLRRHRAYELLARHGFDSETCREAVSRFLEGDGTEPGAAGDT